MPFQEIHLIDLNEFLADNFLKYNSGFEVELKDFTLEGYININTQKSGVEFKKENIDFDLSGCECSGLFDKDYSDFINKAIYTDSPYELTEFLLTHLSYIKMLVCLIEGSWTVQLLDYRKSDPK